MEFAATCRYFDLYQASFSLCISVSSPCQHWLFLPPALQSGGANAMGEGLWDALNPSREDSVKVMLKPLGCWLAGSWSFHSPRCISASFQELTPRHGSLAGLGQEAWSLGKGTSSVPRHQTSQDLLLRPLWISLNWLKLTHLQNKTGNPTRREDCCSFLFPTVEEACHRHTQCFSNCPGG